MTPLPPGWTPPATPPPDGTLCDVLTPLGERGPFVYRHWDRWEFVAPRGARFQGSVIGWRVHTEDTGHDG